MQEHSKPGDPDKIVVLFDSSDEVRRFALGLNPLSAIALRRHAEDADNPTKPRINYEFASRRQAGIVAKLERAAAVERAGGLGEEAHMIGLMANRLSSVAVEPTESQATPEGYTTPPDA